MSKLKSYHFSAGDSSKGAIGICARITATSKKEAVALLKQALPEEERIRPYNDTGVDYINVYINESAITAKDIDEWEVVESQFICECGEQVTEDELINGDECPNCGRAVE